MYIYRHAIMKVIIFQIHLSISIASYVQIFCHVWRQLESLPHLSWLKLMT